ncbi:Uncharacterised protein [Klebsiella pneumoniae]|nr:Uncharacterised protein [Klebsiella pneumoniae]
MDKRLCECTCKQTLPQLNFWKHLSNYTIPSRKHDGEYDMRYTYPVKHMSGGGTDSRIWIVPPLTNHAGKYKEG